MMWVGARHVARVVREKSDGEYTGEPARHSDGETQTWGVDIYKAGTYVLTITNHEEYQRFLSSLLGGPGRCEHGKPLDQWCVLCDPPLTSDRSL